MRLAVPLTLIFTTTLLAACNDDTTNTDEVGDTTESTDSTGSESESESSESADTTETDDTTETTTDDTTETTTDDTTETDTTEDTTETGDGMCNADDVEDVEIMLGLVGSQSPPNGCNDHVFTGTLENGGGGVWNLDACPCGAQCLVPDPYAMTIVGAAVEMLPNVPMCQKIEIRRNMDCEIVSMTISNLNDDEKPVWIGSREDVEPGTVDELDVSSVLFGVCDCPDCDPPTLYELAFDWQGDDLVLAEGDQGVLPASDGDWDVFSLSSHTREVAGTEHFAWIMKR
jgi:hypothetical protein